MALADDLSIEVAKILKDAWTKRDGTVVPDAEDLTLGNDAIELDAVVLYADIDGSTQLVDTVRSEFAAEIYKTFLHCAAKIVRDEGGTITAYDGDRLMAVFIGGLKNTSAARAGLRINAARLNIINPAIKTQYANSTYQLRHTVGIDSAKLLVARTGVRGANDLVWVGRAANHAAKLTALGSDYPTRITAEVYNMLREEVKFTKGQPMWVKASWAEMGRVIYQSTWYWPV